MTFTPEEIREAGERARAEVEAQGFDWSITDPVILLSLARDFNDDIRHDISYAPVDVNALRAERPAATAA